jgi:hypothetical protein
MRKDFYLRILSLVIMGLFLLALAAVIGCFGEPGTKTPEVPAVGPPPIDISGNWKSTAVEDLGNGYFGTREIHLTPTVWEVIFTQYLDKEMTKPVYVYRASGTYVIGAASAAVGGAYDIVFTVSNKYLTLKADDAQVIKSAGLEFCNFLKKDTEVDISGLGCSSFMTVGGCPQEFDIVKIEGADLLLGKRLYSDYLCSEDRRPEELGPPLIKY